MGWKLKFIEDLDEYRKQGNHVTPGCCWLAPWLVDKGVEESWFAMSLSPEYRRDWADKRPPLIIRLPNGDDWQPDARFGDGNGGLKEHGWVLTGEILNTTAMPSINAMRTQHEWGYHGWLKDGVLSDDLEGRTYEWVMPPSTKQVMDFIMSGTVQTVDGRCEYCGYVFKKYTPEHPTECYIMKNGDILWDSQRNGSWFATASIIERKAICSILTQKG